MVGIKFRGLKGVPLKFVIIIVNFFLQISLTVGSKGMVWDRINIVFGYVLCDRCEVFHNNSWQKMVEELNFVKSNSLASNQISF